MPKQNDRIMTLSNLSFEEKDKVFLLSLYEEGKSEGIFSYYKRIVETICDSYSSLINAIYKNKYNEKITEPKHHTAVKVIAIIKKDCEQHKIPVFYTFIAFYFSLEVH